MTEDVFNELAEIMRPGVQVSSPEIIRKAKESALKFCGEESRYHSGFLSGYYESKIFILCEIINIYGSDELKQKINSVI